jgi:DNA-3-methyladenine glycosylase II
MSTRTLTRAGYRQAELYLAERDPVLRGLIAAYGACGLARSQREDPFTALVEAIVWQQLSGKAAATIYKRVLALLPNNGPPTPEGLLAIAEGNLRAAGLSHAKSAYVRDLAARVRDGHVHLEALERLEDEAVIEELTKVKGIGRWTAEMFLMFRLHRPDVLPVDDVGIVNALRKAYRLRKAPKPERMRKIAEAWRPYRSVACWYLWQSLEAVPGGGIDTGAREAPRV